MLYVQYPSESRKPLHTAPVCCPSPCMTPKGHETWRSSGSLPKGQTLSSIKALWKVSSTEVQQGGKVGTEHWATQEAEATVRPFNLLLVTEKKFKQEPPSCYWRRQPAGSLPSRFLAPCSTKHKNRLWACVFVVIALVGWIQLYWMSAAENILHFGFY